MSVCPSHSATRCHQELAVRSIPGAGHPKGLTAPYCRELWDLENPVTWSTVGPGGHVGPGARKDLEDLVRPGGILWDLEHPRR